MRSKLVALAAFAMFAAACGSSSNSSTSPSPTPTPTTPSNGSTVSIVTGARTMTTTAFNPDPIAVAVGSKVTFTNTDSIAHTATSDGGIFDTGTIAPGSSATVTFSSAGSYAYHCSIHPNMVGSVTVQ